MVTISRIKYLKRTCGWARSDDAKSRVRSGWPKKEGGERYRWCCGDNVEADLSRDSSKGLTICDCLTTPEPAAREVRICSSCIVWIILGISCYETSVCRQEKARTFVSSPLVSGSDRMISWSRRDSSAIDRTWKEQSRLSSTLIIAPALSNSPQ